LDVVDDSLNYSEESKMEQPDLAANLEEIFGLLVILVCSDFESRA
jgi:hypothetical protein